MNTKKIVFQSCPKQSTKDLDKAISPEETLRIFYDRVKSLNLKIVNEIKRIDTGRLDIPVFFSVYGDDAQKITGSKKAMGKGASVVQAEASACMELSERFSFFSFKKNAENFLVGDYITMAAKYPVMPLSFLLQSVSDCTTSEERLKQLLQGIPMQWVWGTNISRDKEVLIPFSWFFAINEYNGSSAGNTPEEAALQGVCEVVERHVCARITEEKLTVPEIAPDSIKELVAKELWQKFASRGIEIRLSDFSLDTGIPTVAAVAIDPASFPQRSEIVYTAGTAPNAEKALIRTLTEVAQLGGDFETSSNYLASGLPKPQSMDDVAFLYGDKKCQMNNLPDCTDSNIKVELDRCVQALAAIDLDVFMVDVSHPGLQIPAMYTIIPGAAFRERSRLSDAGLFAARLALELIEDSDKRAAVLEKMESLSPQRYYLSFYRGRELYNAGNFIEAYGYLDKAASTDDALPEDLPFIYSYMGLCLRDMEQYDAAIAILQKGLEYDEERPDIYNTLGVCCFKKGAYEQAITHFKRAVELDPASAMDYANIGVNYLRLGKKSEAREFLTLATTLDESLDFARQLLTDGSCE